MLAARGAKVVLAARRVDKLVALTSRIIANGGDAACLAVDVTRGADLAVAFACERYGRRCVRRRGTSCASPSSRLASSARTWPTRWRARSPRSSSRSSAQREKMGIAPDAIARAIAFAIQQPPEVDVGDIVIRPTAQS